MAIIHAASIINLPLCIWGNPGVGKTAMIRAFGRIREKKNNRSKSTPSFQLHTFHNGTKANDFFGVTTFKEGGEISFINGTLTTAMKDGYIFIADEMNVSPAQTMKSLSPALEPNFGESIYIPGVDQNITIHNSFHFIACQNFLGTIGRNAIPESIINRFSQLNFPEQIEEDIKDICIKIKNAFYQEKMNNPKFSDKEAALCGEYMLKFNKIEQRLLPKWSLRDITKIFKRMVFQEKNMPFFLNIKITHNLMFYTFSSISEKKLTKESFENGKTFIEKILELIKEVFKDECHLNENDIIDLKHCYFDKPQIKNDDGSNKYFLMKYNIGIDLDFIQTFFQSNNIYSGDIKDLNIFSSFSNDFFKILLSDNEEPMLLTGPTGYKTFLSQLILKDTIPVTVNQESTVEQLLGNSTFLSISEAKLFYLKNICNICDSGQYEELEKRLLSKNPKDQITEKDLDNLSEDKSTPFKYALEELKKKLLKKDEDIVSKNILSDMILEFKPGLILTAILSQKKLILKNLSNLPTTVLERFNELFSGKHNLTINEDIHNTFTPSNDKELSNFRNFRVFATCPSGLIFKLSESVLSRFTVVHVGSYTKDEQKYVLKSYCKSKKLSVGEEEIEKLIHDIDIYKETKKKIINLNQMITILYFTSKLNDKIKNNKDFNFSLILFRFLNGYNTTRNYEKYLLNLLFKEGETINIEKNGENPLEESKDIKGNKGIISKITNIFINTTHPLSKMKICFTRNLIDMIDILHLGIFAEIPIIFEGENGSGKNTAIQYVAESLGLEVINIILSQSTNTEQLLGKVQITKNEKNEIKVEVIKTKLRKSLEDPGKSIIVFHNLNNATAAVLELITNIFDYKQQTVLLPDGSKVNKRPINIVGLFEPQNGIISRDKLPDNLKQSSIYHILKSQTKEEKLKDLSNIIETKFHDSKYIDDDGKTKDFLSDIEDFTIRYSKVYNYLEEQNEKVLTYNDITKYIILRKAVKNKLDDRIISQLIFAYCQSNQSKIEKILKILNLDETKFNPSFILGEQELYIKLGREAKDGLILPIFKELSKDEKKDINNLLETLTKPQRQCILFLASTYLSGRTSLIQGPTASGKSLIIRIFSKIMGKKLNIYQMNSETEDNIIYGQSLIMERLDENEIFTLTQIFDSVNNIINKDLMHNKGILDLKRKDFENIIKSIDDELNTQQFSIGNLKKLKNYKYLINKIISPPSRFKTLKSTFIKSMENGDWILIDGIESAPPQVAEKISSLCGDNPELDLIECGPEFCYSLKEKNGYKKINKEFRIFITYNPFESKNSAIIEQALLTKCITFCLPSIDSKLDYSSQIFYSSLKNAGYDKFLMENIAPRLSKVHSFVFKDSINNTEKYCGNIQITGRKIIFITKEFNNKNYKEFNGKINIIKRQIVDAFRFFYYLGYNDIKHLPKYKKEITTEFKENVEAFKSNDLNIEDIHRPLLELLRKIQIFRKNEKLNNEELFDFSKFIQLCLDIRIDSLEFINWHIKDTLRIIEENKSLNKYNKSYFKQISIISNILKEIIPQDLPQTKDLELTVKNLLQTKTLKKPVLKLVLLLKLLSKESYFTKNLDLNKLKSLEMAINILFEKIKLLYDNQNLENFKIFVKELNKIDKEGNSYMKYAKLLFPNAIFSKTKIKLINIWIDLIIKLYENKNTFIIQIGEETIKFNYKKDKNAKKNTESLDIKLIFEDNDLLLKENSLIMCSNTKMTHKITEKNIKETFKFYRLICELYKIKNIEKGLKDEKLEKLENYKTFELSLPYKSEYFNISNYFISKQEHTLIGIAWSLIYNLDKKYLEKIKYLSFECLKDLINLNSKSFEDLKGDKDIESIMEYTKSFSSFCNDSSYLWRIINNNFIYDLEDSSKINLILKGIRREKTLIERLKIDKKELFDNNKYIKILDDKINEIESKQKEHKKQEKIEKLKIDFNKQIIGYLKQVEIKDEVFNQLRNRLLSKLNIIVSEETLNDETFEKYKKQVDEFIASVEKNCVNKEKVLNWSQPNYFEIQNNSEEIKILEQILWYSKYYHILNQIKPETPRDIITNLIKEIILQKDEMQEVGNYLWDCYYFQNSGLEINKMNKIIYSSLNAFFINRLSNKNLLDYLKILDQIINKIAKRHQINNNLFLWGNKLAKSIDKEFKLYLPKFTFSDMIFLYIIYKSNVEKIKGPALNNINNDDLIPNLEDLSKLIDMDFDSHQKCMDNIAGVFFYNIFDPKSQKRELEHEKLKDLFQKELSKLSNNSNNNKNALLKGRLCEGIIFHLKLSEELDKLTYKLEYPELEEYQNKPNYNEWLTNRDFVDKYPTIVFWCYKYNKYFKQFPEFDGNEKEIPFWFFIFRILSSLKSVKIEDENLFSSYIDDHVSNLIKDKLENSKYPKIGTLWINLLINEVPENISNNILRMIYIFLCKICKDKKALEINLQNIKEETIKGIIKQFYTYIFENNLEEIISCSKEISKFLYNPNTYIYQEIINELNKQFQTIQKEINIVDSYNKIKNIIPNNKLNLISQAEDENKKLLEEFRESKEKDEEIECINKIRLMKEKLNNYNIMYNNNKDKGEVLKSKIKSEGQNYDKIKELIYKISNIKLDNITNEKKNI